MVLIVRSVVNVNVESTVVVFETILSDVSVATHLLVVVTVDVNV